MCNHTFLLLNIITAAILLILSIITMFPIQSDHLSISHHLFTVSAALLNVTFIISTWVIASHIC